MANEIASALADNAEIVAEAILGEPSHRGREENRWGSRGSLAVRIKGPRRGLWFDHERGEGGDAIDLIARERGVDRRRAYEIAKTEFVGPTLHPLQPAQRQSPAPAASDDHRRNTDIALRMWHEATDIGGTAAATYLVEHRGLDVTELNLSHTFCGGTRDRRQCLR
jgi:putative DNA primase/helicase